MAYLPEKEQKYVYTPKMCFSNPLNDSKFDVCFVIMIYLILQ